VTHVTKALRALLRSAGQGDTSVVASAAVNGSDQRTNGGAALPFGAVDGNRKPA
jgi:hypothetical protein